MRFAFFNYLFIAIGLLTSGDMVAQNTPAASPAAPSVEKNAASKKEEQSKKEVEDSGKYTHEVSGLFNIDNFTGTADTGTATPSSALNIQLSALYGYIVNENLEPVAELDYLSGSGGLGSDSSDTKAGSEIRIGVGMRVNLPVAHSETGKKSLEESKFIPWMGFIISSVTASDKVGTTSLGGSNLGIKLTFGNRYRLLDDVTINSSMRIQYDSNNTKDESSASVTSTSMVVELRLATISLFF